jgi:hypothetical protein
MSGYDGDRHCAITAISNPRNPPPGSDQKTASSRIIGPSPLFPDGLLKLLQLGLRAFGHEFHATIGQIAHKASHFKTGGHLPGLVAETHSPAPGPE